MCQLTQSSAEGVVLRVVERVGEVVAASDGGFAVRGTVGFVGYEVDLAEEAGFVVFEFADHGGGEVCSGRCLAWWEGVKSESALVRASREKN